MSDEELQHIRMLDTDFMRDLTDPAGVLNGLKERIVRDDTLMLAIRKNYVNVYYRGGNLLRLQALGNHRYSAFFDANYCSPTGAVPPTLPTTIAKAADCADWIETFPILAQIMNGYFAAIPKSEREFQQLVAWENNRSGLSNESEYFITDIEFASSLHSGRFDMVGVKWCAGDRKSGLKCRPFAVEMKYGRTAYHGDAGIVKHIADFDAFFASAPLRTHLEKSVSSQFNQLDDLGLLLFNRSANLTHISASGRPEVVFIFANDNPRSGELLGIIEQIQEPQHYDLRFFIGTFAGYAMHHDCMANLTEFREILRNQKTKKSKNTLL